MSAKENLRNEIWKDKYRPQTLNEIIGHEKPIRVFKNYVSKGFPDHVLLAGPPGVGKTTIALAIAKELYGEDWADNTMELNASDDRGIDVVRTQIRSFARTSTFSEVGYKILILDEADALTPDAQTALRRTMEKYQHNCRFVLTCNYPSNIISPLVSRCTPFIIPRLKDDDIEKYIDRICENENLTITEEAKQYLIAISDGDARHSPSKLQTCSLFTNEIDVETIKLHALLPDKKRIGSLMNMARQGKFIEARQELISEFVNNGFDPSSIVKAIASNLIEMQDIPPIKLVNLHDRLSDIEDRIQRGQNPTIHLSAFLSRMTLEEMIPVHCQECSN